MLHLDCRDFGQELYRGPDLTKHATPTTASKSPKSQTYTVLFGVGSYRQTNGY